MQTVSSISFFYFASFFFLVFFFFFLSKPIKINNGLEIRIWLCEYVFFLNHRGVLGKQTGLLAPSYKIVAKSDRYDIKILYNTYFIVIE